MMQSGANQSLKGYSLFSSANESWSLGFSAQLAEICNGGDGIATGVNSVVPDRPSGIIQTLSRCRPAEGHSLASWFPSEQRRALPVSCRGLREASGICAGDKRRATLGTLSETCFESDELYGWTK
jgi:hypothetical protein